MLKTLSAYISFNQLVTQGWALSGRERVFCPVHKKEEWPGKCAFLLVIVAPEDTEVVITDVGSRGIEPAELPGWVCLGGKGTHGGAHNSYTYVRIGMGIEKNREVVRGMLYESSSSLVYQIEERSGGFVVYTTEPGPWIGRGGRWVKAYRNLGVEVQIREATLVDLRGLEESKRKEVKGAALWVRKIETREFVSIGALIPGRHNGFPYFSEIRKVTEVVQ